MSTRAMHALDIATRSARLQVLGRPLAGSDWTADNGPSLHSHHRQGVFVAGGLAQNARRYAIDWKIYRDGEINSGDARDVRAYHAYGRDGEGLPYLFDRFRMRVGEGKWEVRTREYPLDGAVIDFGAN